MIGTIARNQLLASVQQSTILRSGFVHRTGPTSQSAVQIQQPFGSSTGLNPLVCHALLAVFVQACAGLPMVPITVNITAESDVLLLLCTRDLHYRPQPQRRRRRRLLSRGMRSKKAQYSAGDPCNIPKQQAQYS